MNIGIIDADLLDNGTRHPNLALMKISAFNLEAGHKVKLLTSYDQIREFDKIFISKVFSGTKVPIDLSQETITYGGTGFFFDKAPDLPSSIEHHMPDYHLYDDFVRDAMQRGERLSKYSDYLDYSIGFTTRGCFRKCSFCVNRKYSSIFKHSPVEEFFDPTRKYIYLWDDNFLGFNEWEVVLAELESTGRPFQFRQGLDIRLLTKEKAILLSKVKYHGDFIFAFDSIKDEPFVRKGLNTWRRYSQKSTKLYLLCGYESADYHDIVGVFYRIKVLMEYGCLPYIMRFDNWNYSKYAGIYITLARWCNQPAILKKMSFRQFCEANGSTSSSMRYLRWFIDTHPEFPSEYLDMRFEDQNKYS